jgi:hypothetical protein
MHNKIKGVSRGSFSLNLFFLIAIIVVGLIAIFQSIF